MRKQTILDNLHCSDFQNNLKGIIYNNMGYIIKWSLFGTIWKIYAFGRIGTSFPLSEYWLRKILNKIYLMFSQIVYLYSIYTFTQSKKFVQSLTLYWVKNDVETDHFLHYYWKSHKMIDFGTSLWCHWECHKISFIKKLDILWCDIVKNCKVWVKLIKVDILL